MKRLLIMLLMISVMGIPLAVSAQSPNQVPPKIPWAQQAGVPGGVDLIDFCVYYNFYDAKNFAGHADDWWCLGTQGNWKADWNIICRDVYGSSFVAYKIDNSISGWRCYASIIVYPTLTPWPQPTLVGGCPPYATMVAVGWTVYVSGYDNLRLRFRAGPGLKGRVLRLLPVGGPLTIIGGPYCADGYRWYQVQYGRRIGWVAEIGPSGVPNLVTTRPR